LLNNMNSNFATQEVMATLSSTRAARRSSIPTILRRAFARRSATRRPTMRSDFAVPNQALRRRLSQIDDQDQPAWREAGIPARLLCAGGFSSIPGVKTASAISRSSWPATCRLPIWRLSGRDVFSALNEDRFFVPVSLIVPGSQIPFVKGGDKDKATLDIIGSVIERVQAADRSRARDGEAESRPELGRRGKKNIQYTTSFNLPPGSIN